MGHGLPTVKYAEACDAGGEGGGGEGGGGLAVAAVQSLAEEQNFPELAAVFELQL